MINKLNGINFGQQTTNIRDSRNNFNPLTTPNKLLRQPLTDEVSFTGGLKAKTLFEAARKLGLSVERTGGKHGVKILGMQRPIPVPMHGGTEIATGTAHSIAKQMGFKNVDDLLQFLRKA